MCLYNFVPVLQKEVVSKKKSDTHFSIELIECQLLTITRYLKF